MAIDSSGNIYGTTWLGGAYSLGTVFSLDRDGNEKVLHSFASGSDRANPIGGPVLVETGRTKWGRSSVG